jgi:hypothetical protein
MPQLNLDDLQLASDYRKTPQIIEGEVLHSEQFSLGLEDPRGFDQEPPFPEDGARDREPTLESLINMVPNGPLRAIRTDLVNDKADLLEQLTKALPLNEFDLPIYLYRPDLLDEQFILEHMNLLRTNVHSPSLQAPDPTATTTSSPAEGEVPNLHGETGLITKPISYSDIQAHLDAAIVTLSYDEGFPTLRNGTPLWQRLDFEPQDAFNAFIEYLDLGAKRSLHALILTPLEQNRQYFHTYFWAFRVRAFDLFQIATAQKQRIARMLNTEDNHYKLAEKLMGTVTSVLDQFTTEEVKEVGFEKLVKLLDPLSKLQRISAGLPANGALSADERIAAPTTNIIMQQIAEKAPRKQVDEDDTTDMLYGNDEILEAAQDLILKSDKARPINE